MIEKGIIRNIDAVANPQNLMNMLMAHPGLTQDNFDPAKFISAYRDLYYDTYAPDVVSGAITEDDINRLANAYEGKDKAYWADDGNISKAIEAYQKLAELRVQ